MIPGPNGRTSREVSRGKPDPQVFTVAAEMLGLSPRSCAVVEDAPAGIEAALAAGAAAIALTGQHPTEKLSRAHLVVHSLRELSAEGIRELVTSCRASGYRRATWILCWRAAY